MAMRFAVVSCFKMMYCIKVCFLVLHVTVKTENKEIKVCLQFIVHSRIK